MTLLFIENRYKTYFFEPIAKKLKDNGFEVHFLVQNKEFSLNKNFKEHIIPYPKNKNLQYQKINEVEEVIESDRQQNYFRKKSQSYFYYYYHEIDKIIDNLKPDFVFGESTAFHELLTISLCKKKEILYLNPSSCRYPIGRFCFYKYNTLEPYKGSGIRLDDQKALDTINGIVNRTSKPDYMASNKQSTKRNILDKLVLVKGYLFGERYNTPNPIIKRQVEKTKTNNILKWDSFSKEKVEKNSKFKVLYPLQMQPEANIDVWGKPYRDQLNLVKDILQNLPNDSVLYIKPNPKSKYELSKELVEFVKSNDSCIALHHSVKMDEIIFDIDLVITVTGTIAIECILSNKPVATMMDTINNYASNCFHLETLGHNLNDVITAIKSNAFPKLSDTEKIDFINKLNATSYKGVISDPFSDPNCTTKVNINNLENAFLSIVSK